MYRPENCITCGTCLSECSFLNLDTQEAAGHIRRLREGEKTEVLEACITCMACNEFCPQGANPYDLILQAQERHRICMIPPEAVSVIEQTLAGQPTEVIPGDPARPALCVCTMERGCPPDMLTSSLLSGMTIARGGDFFSRVVYLHTGMESAVRRHAAACIDSLAALGHEEVVFLHSDCYVLAAHKAPEYGIAVPFQPVHIAAYLHRVLQERRDEIQPLGRSVAMQRPCIHRYAPELEPQVDALLERAGARRVERRFDRRDALCCGLGMGSTDTARTQDLARRNIADSLEHQAEAMVFVCPGCYVSLGAACDAQGLHAIFLTDLCRMAIGELPWSSRPLPNPPASPG